MKKKVFYYIVYLLEGSEKAVPLKVKREINFSKI